jgi:hypothetical protein
MPSSPRLLTFVVAFISLSGGIVYAQDYTCDALADSTGPCQYQLNGVCDSNLGDNPLPGCESGDCLDCNIFCESRLPVVS